MMCIWTVRLGLSLMVVVGMWTNRTPAQQTNREAAPEVLLMPAAKYEPGHQPNFGMPFVPKTHPQSANHAVRRTLNNHGLGCENDSFFAGCANWRYEARFIFGSCRSFFGESCPPGSLCGPRVTPR